jgi:hypothetical protein
VEDPTVDLVQRLGAPAHYAEELRQSAGLPPRGTDVCVSWAERIDRSRTALAELISSWPGGRSVLGFLPQLRPAWWLLRAFGVVQIADRVVHGLQGYGYRWNHGLIPTLHGNRSLGLLGLLGTAVLSVRIGRLTPAFSSRRRALLVVVNAVLVVATLSYFHLADRRHTSTVTVTPCCGTIFGPEGRPVFNVFAYDENGKPISRVQLFDQDGLPLDSTANDSDGSQLLHNVFPQAELATYTSDGTPTEAPKPPPVVAAPALAPLPTPAASPTPTASPTPSTPAAVRGPVPTP